MPPNDIICWFSWVQKVLEQYFNKMGILQLLIFFLSFLLFICLVLQLMACKIFYKQTKKGFTQQQQPQKWIAWCHKKKGIHETNQENERESGIVEYCLRHFAIHWTRPLWVWSILQLLSYFHLPQPRPCFPRKHSSPQRNGSGFVIGWKWYGIVFFNLPLRSSSGVFAQQEAYLAMGATDWYTSRFSMPLLPEKWRKHATLVVSMPISTSVLVMVLRSGKSSACLSKFWKHMECYICQQLQEILLGFGCSYG